MADQFQKAEIRRDDGSGDPVICHFNPTDFSITRNIKWEEAPNVGGNQPRKVFSGGETSDMTIKLLFDVSSSETADVRDSYKALLEMAEIDPKKVNSKTGKGEPAQCRFIWGNFLSFKAIIKSIKQNFVMFRADGTPIRANVEVTFEQLEEDTPKKQNPTSVSEPRKIWVVRAGQTLDWIAYTEYGDPNYWRHIADTNNILNPKDLQAGQVLKLTPLP
jgi:LysM repeat protein